MKRARVAVALVHWPVQDKLGNTVCTNITNFDVHDIARASRTFGVEKYYIVNRMQVQLTYLERMLEHWRLGKGADYNHMRKTALTMVEGVETLEQAVSLFEKETGYKPILVTTSARDELLGAKDISFQDLRAKIWNLEGNQSYLLVFGTGFGLHRDVMEGADLHLEPIRGGSEEDYRHLSVRSAVTIILDRLLGKW